MKSKLFCVNRFLIVRLSWEVNKIHFDVSGCKFGGDIKILNTQLTVN